MPTKTNAQQIQNADENSAAKSAMMEDAPLFAGLDDFVLFQPAKKEKQKPAAGPVAEKKKSAPRRPLRSQPEAEPVPQPAPLVQRVKPTDPNAVLLSVKEMCTLLKISRATLVRMDKAGKIPGRIKLGGSVRFHRETIENWIRGMVSS